jgi:hypothetical protein
MQNTTTHDTKIADTKMQKTAPKKAVSVKSAHPSAVAPKVVSPPAKHIKLLLHGSHKVEYRKDHPKTGAGVKTPSSPVLK